MAQGMGADLFVDPGREDGLLDDLPVENVFIEDVFGFFRGFIVNSFHMKKGEISLLFLRRPDLTVHRISRSQREFLDLRR